MVITVSVELGEGETLAYPPDMAAMQVLVALGGNAQNDYCSLVMIAPKQPGEAGVPPPPPLIEGTSPAHQTQVEE